MLFRSLLCYRQVLRVVLDGLCIAPLRPIRVAEVSVRPALPCPVAHLLCNRQALRVVLDPLYIVSQRLMRVAEGARADTRTAAKPTADQMHVLKMLEQLAGAADWRGVAAQGRAARTVAAAVRTSIPGDASFVYGILGIAYQSLGDFNKAIEYHTMDLAIAKEAGG